MPGGPTNPDKILEAILDLGADHQTDHLMLGTDARWLKIVSGAWYLDDVQNVRISRATYDALRTADRQPVDNCVRIGGDLFRLDDVDGYAVLTPA